MWQVIVEKILPFAALFLSVVNGMILLVNFFRDAPKLKVAPVHPEIYQCWIRLSDVLLDQKTFRRYAFISYFSVANCGIRNVAVNAWRLKIHNCRSLPWLRIQELKPYSIPEPQCSIGELLKAIKVFGQKTQNFDVTSNMVQSGDTISGVSCWMYSVWGDKIFDPQISSNRIIRARLNVGDVFGGTATCTMRFPEKSLDELREIFPSVAEFLDTQKNV